MAATQASVQPTTTAPLPTLPQPSAAVVSYTAPACLTASVMEGPYFKANSPERAVGTGLQKIT